MRKFWFARGSDRSIYVSKSGSVYGDGSIGSPVDTVQRGVDLAEILAPSINDPVSIFIDDGEYVEDVVINCVDGLSFYGSTTERVCIKAAAEAALTITNATPASLATYNTTGVYSDLSAHTPAVAGVRRFVANKVRFLNTIANKSTIRLLGVKGDATANTTNFGYDNVDYIAFRFVDCWIQKQGAGSGYPLFAKNVYSLSNQGRCSYQGNVRTENARYVTFIGTTAPDPEFKYDIADPDGRPDQALAAYLFQGGFYDDMTFQGSITASVRNTYLGDLLLSDTTNVSLYDCYLQSQGLLDVDDTATATLQKCFLFKVALEGGATATLTDCFVDGTFSAAAGAGIVTLNDTPVTGVITDVSGKIIRGGSSRFGAYTETGGGGDRVISFSPAFSAGTVPIITFGFEDTGSGYQTCRIKTGSLSNTGFNLITSGNGKFHWSAKKVN